MLDHLKLLYMKDCDPLLTVSQVYITTRISGLLRMVGNDVEQIYE